MEMKKSQVIHARTAIPVAQTKNIASKPNVTKKIILKTVFQPTASTNAAKRKHTISMNMKCSMEPALQFKSYTKL